MSERTHNHQRKQKDESSLLENLKTEVAQLRKQVETHNKTVSEYLKPLAEKSDKILGLNNQFAKLVETSESGKPRSFKMWPFRWQVTGTILLFLAWGIQNYLQKDNQLTISKHNSIIAANSQQALHADILEYNGRLFDYLYLRDSSAEMKLSAIDAYQNYCQSILTISGNAYQMQYVDGQTEFSHDDLNGQIDTVRILKDSINALAGRNSLDTLRYFFQTEHDYSTDIMPGIAAELSKARTNLEIDGKTENIIFISIYFLGTLFVGIGFYLNNQEKFKQFFQSAKAINKKPG